LLTAKRREPTVRRMRETPSRPAPRFLDPRRQPKPSMRITQKAKEERFVAEYLKDLSGAAAAQRCGYKGASAQSTATQMLAKQSVQARIQAELDERIKRTEVSTDRVLRQAARQAFFDPRRLLDPVSGNPLPLAELPEDIALAIQSVKVTRDTLDGETLTETLEVKFSDRNKAVENLMRYLGMFEKDNSQQHDQLDSLFKYLEQHGASRLVAQPARPPGALAEDARIVGEDRGGRPGLAAQLVVHPGTLPPENPSSSESPEKIFFDRLMR
jgi:phage terminase small subunit